jgi:hypothetical protein
MTTFDIGSQTAGSIQNVGGDLTIGHLHVEAGWSAVTVQQELARVQEALDGAPISHPTRAAAESALAAARAEAAGPEPDRARISELLQRATQVLSNAGLLTSAGTGLAESLRRAAVALGPAGKAVLTLLPMV